MEREERAERVGMPGGEGIGERRREKGRRK